MPRLTSRERVERAFARREHDRVPRYESFWAETIQRWESEGLSGGYEGALDALGADLHSCCWIWPAPFPGRWEELAGDEETTLVRDPWGGLAKFWRKKSGTPEHHGFGCQTRQDWEKTYRPAFLASPVQLDLDACARSLEQGRRRERWCFFASVESFEMLRKLIGDEVFLVAMLEDPEWVRDISRVSTDLVLREMQAALDRGIRPDGIWIYGDMAYNHATLCSPQLYRELIWPDHKRMADWAHARGMKFIFHTDGDVNAVLPDYLDAGFDALQPLEAKAGMDLRRLGPAHGDRLVFFGNCDVMRYATNDLAQIEAEVAAKLAAGKATRGYIYHSDHSVPPQVSWRTYQEIIRMIDRHGAYGAGSST